ncbi:MULTISPECIES: endopeptidase La [unclassified Paenibacillus]|uniref:endopeptidase La n=1 Tax=unclassified Paenibacillus TaxID=185978 RepID=UPI002405902C|nr:MULTISPECIES: endopeptidase La [unclassified Paenibacillus]MDF9844063.1 ATP-dependent Lon protease [Paenibacillus sp. PastF-2]MDF9850668.1 ATP-dependent Lon protease [Paenibacillus sp. PastM-2]MDF9857181.1 ATP-dependent Lon protease [Paenibacillus sp. PastF-1]MDH6482518.1 ATP-dependent Lon protease [Paenibacillus sp. PastH-2]MDH6509879.1 ATP-dependent Lon protease [Paenibacillus sp. PastM-3]
MMPNKSKGRRFPLLPLRGLLVYPSMVLHLDVGREKSVRALEKAMVEDNLILLCSQSEVNIEEPGQEDIFRVGTVANVRQMLKLPNGTIRVLVEGVERAEIIHYTDNEEFYEVMARELPEQEDVDQESDALMRTVLSQFEHYITLSKKVTPETLAAVSDIEEPGRLADVITSHLALKIKDKQEILETIDVSKRLEKLLDILNNEREVLELERKINQRVKKQMEKTQKEYYLREQMKAIQKELGEKEGRAGEAEELRSQMQEKNLPERVQEKIEKEIDRLEKMPASSAEGSVIRNYVDWLLGLPWSEETEDDLDIQKAEQVLDADHYGLEKPKERVLEYLAVQKLVKELKGPILCLVGPPGVGKTSLARSIARSLNRKFVRISLGGVRDEAEIRGHRRTYVGAMPGRIIQGMKTAGSLNPVFLLDEIDKMASDFRGDPSAALLEVLDPEQNNTFSDHFVELPFDLSKVMFVTTANVVHNIPRPLLDRMEMLYIPGYTELEKLQIASRYLLPKQRKNHGLEDAQLVIEDDTLLKIVREYTRESGVRNLEQQIAALCRKAAKQIVSSEQEQVTILPGEVKEYLGESKYRYGMAELEDQIGTVTGLAWTEVGGDTLLIEVTVVQGTGKLTLTGKLGDVMKESAQAAFSYTRSKAEELGLAPDFHEKNDIHIHIPEGAIPKDGPSAGITIATALISALTRRYVSKDVAMTGEITLRGRVLPIGGLKEKSLAAHRAGYTKILLPKDNERDLKDIPESVRNDVEFIPVSHMDQVLQHALVDQQADVSSKAPSSVH